MMTMMMRISFRHVYCTRAGDAYAWWSASSFSNHIFQAAFLCIYVIIENRAAVLTLLVQLIVRYISAIFVGWVFKRSPNSCRVHHGRLIDCLVLS